MKKIISFIMAIVLVLSTCTTAFAAETTSDSQVTNQGGTNSEKWNSDKVRVSKTIEGTDIENVFDITLKVETQTKIETLYDDPDIAVCIIMDISNTMMEDYSGSTKFQAALTASEAVVDQFAAFTVGAQSKLGFVAFNTDGNSIAAMQRCDTTARATTFKNTVRTNTQKIINKYNNDSDYYTNNRYTNIEAGLKMAKDMLAACNNSHKFAIFLSDGLPTTYIKSGYTGYSPRSSEGTVGNNGVFYDKISGEYCPYGTNYSDKGAIRARQEATRLKNSGVTVYTVGAGLNTFKGDNFDGRTTPYQNLTGAQNIQNQMERAFKTGVRTIDNTFTKINRWNASTINNYKWEIGNYQGSYHPLTNSDLFENWLKYSIGSNQFINTTKSSEIANAFKKIFEDLQKQVQEEHATAWIVNDPMGTNVEFIGFYDKNNKLTTEDLVGEMGAGKENTATFSSNAFNWEIQKSGYTSTTSGSTTTYTYTLKYRVRLTNEAASGFVDGTSYNSNKTTTLKYQTVKNSVISEMKTVNFPIPAVKGYLSELTFKKVDQYGKAVAGAKFKLTHDAAKCTECNGHGGKVADTGNLAAKTATSGSDGTVKFTNIPSGHTYKLVETEAPKGYQKDTTQYTVTVAYDVLTTDITDMKITDPMDNYNIRLKKIDGTSGTEKVLSGAQFEVYSDAQMKTLAKHPDGTDFGTLTTDGNGLAELGLVDFNQTYYLKETAAPAGYNKLSDAIKITITPTSTTPVAAYYGTSGLTIEKTTEGNDVIYIIEVSNTPGVELPLTGGPGTLIYTLGGIGLIMASALVYGFRMRQREGGLK